MPRYRLIDSRVAALVCSIFLFACSCAVAEELLPADRPIHEVVDHYIDARLAAEGVNAAPQASETTLLRRLTFDLVGRPAPGDEARAFAASAEPDKVEKLVDGLLQSPGYARYQAYAFDAFLTRGQGSVQPYLLEAFRENRPWDVIFREMIAGDQKDEEQRKALEFMRSRAGDTDRLANEASSLFFGVNVSCAQCHDHPLVPDWRQSHYYGMKSFFNRTFENGGFLGERDYGIVEYQNPDGKSFTAKLMFLTGEKIDEPESREPSDGDKKKEKEQLEKLKKDKKPPPAPKFSRREKLLEVALEDGRAGGYLPRAIVNRVWYQLFGYGLVMPLDQMHEENDASHPELLAWLARDLVAHNYDLKRLVRGLVLSRAYARGSRWESGELPPAKLFAVAQLKPLTPQQMGAAIRMAAAEPSYFSLDLDPAEREKRLESIDSAGRSLVGRFEMPSGEDFQIGVDEALLLSNNKDLYNDLVGDRSRLLSACQKEEDNLAMIDLLFWNALGRPASPEEEQLILEHLASRPENREQACRQVLWAVLTGSEFRFNH